MGIFPFKAQLIFYTQNKMQIPVPKTVGHMSILENSHDMIRLGNRVKCGVFCIGKVNIWGPNFVDDVQIGNCEKAPLRMA